MTWIVRTRDGRLPKDGGVRLGYEVDGYYIRCGTTTLVPLAPPKPATPRLDEYLQLPRVHGWSCGHCHRQTHTENGVFRTEDGPRPTVYCCFCEKHSVRI